MDFQLLKQMIQENTLSGKWEGGSIALKIKGYLQNDYKTLLNIALTHALIKVSRQDSESA